MLLSTTFKSLNPVFVLNSLQSQPIELSQEELYQNLQGFEVDGDTIISLHGDPWIDVSVGERRLGLRMYINLVLEEGQVLNTQIYYRDNVSWFVEERSFWVQTHNGLNIIEKPIPPFNYLRLDLTDQADERIIVEKVIVDNYQYNRAGFFVIIVSMLLILALVCLYIGNERIPRIQKIYGQLVKSYKLKKWTEFCQKEGRLLSSIQSVFKHSKGFYITTLLVLIGCFLFTLTNPSIGMDDIYFAKFFYPEHVSLMVDRWTYILWLWVIGTLKFLPMSTDFIVVIFLYISGIIYAHLLDVVSKNQVSEVGKTIFSCGVISFSYTAHLFIFMSANIMVMPAFLMTAICMLVFYKMWTNQLNKMVGSAIFIFAGMMANDYGYQFIAVALFILLLLMLTFDDEKVLTLKKTILVTLCYVGLTVLSIIGYYGIGRLLQMIYGVERQAYTTRFFAHDFSQGLISVLFRIVGGIGNMYRVSNTMRMIFIISIVLLVVSVIDSIRKKNIVIFLVAALLCLSPFLLPILLGNMNLPLRTLMHIALFFGFALFYTYDTLRRIPIIGIVLKYCSAIIIASVILRQVILMNTIFYIDFERYQWDRQVSYTMITDINRINTEDKPILFIGQIDFNHPYGTYEFIGRSIFWWDRFGILHSELRSDHVLTFWNFIGYQFTVAPIPDYDLLLEWYESMPAFPQEGYIIDTGDFILIKVGEGTNLVRYVEQ